MPHLKSLYPPIPPIVIPNYYEWLVNLDHVKNSPDITLYIDGVTGERRRLREVLDRVDVCATGLSASSSEGGIGLTEKPEEIVGIFSENVMEFPTLVFSLLKIAVPFSLLPAYSTVSELAALLELSDVTRLFISPAMQATALRAAAQTGFPHDRIYALQGQVRGFKSLSDIIDDARARGSFRVPTRAIDENQLAYMAFSSGTTGFPKAVMVSHRNMYYSSMQVLVVGAEAAKAGKVPSLAHTPEGVHTGLALMPFYHAAALHLSILRSPLVPPTTTVILPRWNVDQAFEAIERYRVTSLVLAPSMTQQMILSPKFQTTDLSSVMGFVTGTAHLALEHRKTVVERMPQLNLTSTYGLTECVVSALQRPTPGLFAGRFSDEVLSTMTGILLPGMEARIVRDDGSEADYDEPGELLLRGCNVVLGYRKNEKASAETFLGDNWLRTGDRFTINKDGAFFYVDRMKDTLKVSGVQVSPSEIEHVLLQQPDKLIVDVTVAGVPGDRFSDEKVPRAWIVLSDEGQRRGGPSVIAALNEWMGSQMAKHKALRGGIEIVAQLPKSPIGKVLRRALQDDYTQTLRKIPDTRGKL
ncbi:acetyl-CoA synthetase-like protein [Dentipellis sp. KUC8613]|nr:acetyl-CoA synthetase-like protein [Dentipellis sp. KUC8613]